MVLLGTLSPLLADALGMGKISVGPPYFGLLFIILMTPLVVLVPFGPLTRWQREEPSRPLRMLAPWAVLALVVGAIAFFTAPQSPLKVAAAAAAGIWVGIGTLRFAWARLRSPSGRLSPEMWGMVLGHVGVALFVVGAMTVSALDVEREVALAPGQTLEVGRHHFRFEGVERVQGPNYLADRGTVVYLRDGREVSVLHPEKRHFASGGQIMTKAAINASPLVDVYAALGEPLGEGAWAVRAHIKPFVRWVWAGAILMALGGIVVAFDRRFRRQS